ncbi:MAG TPA: phosphatase PAP2 family protein [Firmicutes bacterium]|nr:phosphatase PAP2 family protein [Bacillota bacterium]
MWNLISDFISHSAVLFQQYGALGLSVVAFAEASFFPVPPDVVLIPLCLMSPGVSLWYAFLSTVFSTLGGFFGYLIGMTAGRPLLERMAGRYRVSEAQALFSRYGGWAVLIAALTPIPYKVFTIAAGVFRIDKMTFLWASLVGRGMRFFLEAVIIMAMGPAAIEFLTKYSGPLTVGIAILLIAGYLFSRHVGVLLSIRRALNELRARAELALRRLSGPEWELAIFTATGLALGATFLFVFTELAEDLFENELHALGATLTHIVRAAFGPAAVGPMRFFSIVGSPYTLIGVTAIAAYLLYPGPGAWIPPLALIGGATLESLLKAIFQRPRPEYPHLVRALGFSFPSGHATVSAAVFATLAYLAYTRIRPGRTRLLVVITAFALILMIGISRVYLGVHYPSDVLAGFAVGGFWATCCVIAERIMKWRARH